MDKQKFTEVLAEWFQNYILSTYKDLVVDEIYCEPQRLSILNSPTLKGFKNYSSWDFSPDVLAILKNKSSGVYELAFINRSTSALSLKEIGELHCYAKLAKPKYAMLASLIGVSNEVNILLADRNTCDRLLKYDEGNSITAFAWSERLRSPDPMTILPLTSRSLFE